MGGVKRVKRFLLLFLGGELPFLAYFQVAFYEPFYSKILLNVCCVGVSVILFVNHYQGGEPVADLDLQFLVESKPLGQNTSENPKLATEHLVRF